LGPTTVSGLTITSASFQRDQVARETIQNRRSRGLNGRLGPFPLQYGHLLAKRDSDVSANLEEDAGSGNQGEAG
jgi:hypothetical protein